MTERRRVIFVSRKWPPAMGGMETYSEKLSEALRPYVEIETFYLPGHSDGSVPSVWEVLRFGFRAAYRLTFSRTPPAITHVADMASWPLALCARLRNFRGRRVLSAHGTDVSYPLRGGIRGNLYGAYLRLGALVLGSVTVVANSAATADAVQRYGYRDTVVVPLAADVSASKARGAHRSVLFSGRLVPRKGFAWFAKEVLPLLPDDVSLEVAGTVWDSDESAMLDTPKVRYLGRLDQRTLWEFYAQAGCVIVPNIDVPNGEFEGFGLVALEAAAAGGVVLASRHSGLKEAVIDTETGFHLTPGDAQGWASKIIEVLAWSDERRSQFTQTAKKTCAQYFTWDRVALDTLVAYGIERPEAEV